MRRQVNARVRQLPNIARRVITHPRWVLENVWLLRQRRAEARRALQPAQMQPYRASLADALVAVTGAERATVEQACRDLWFPPADAADAPEAWNATHDLMTAVGALVRLLRPGVMLETGVARGYSSAVALAVMRAHEHGHLFSIDLPVLQLDAVTFVGRAIAPELRGRWSLTLGPSRQVLPRLAARIAPIDLFLHDADHTYPSQMLEYRTVWPHLRAGGVLMSDDVGNAAFLDFARWAGVTPHLVLQPGKPYPFGLLCKPPA